MEMIELLTIIGGVMLVIIGFFLRQTMADLKSVKLMSYENKSKIEVLEKICSNEGMEPIIFNLSEYMKSGAMLSCCIMHLNRVDQNKKLL